MLNMWPFEKEIEESVEPIKYYKVTLTTTNGEILTWDNITEDKIKQLNKPFSITIREKNKYKYLYAGGIASILCEEIEGK